MAKLSFVIPTYNSAHTLAEAIASIQLQSVKDVEIIVVDDCSTDTTPSLMKFLCGEDKRIKYKRLNKRGNRSYARNTGLSLATAPIICVNDADDVSYSNRAKVILKAFEKNIDVFYSSFIVVDQFGNGLYKIDCSPFDINEVIADPNHFTRIGHSTMAYKRGLCKYSLGEWATLGVDDWKLQIDLYKKGARFGCSNKYLVGWRYRPNNSVATRNNKRVLKLKGKELEKIKKV